MLALSIRQPWASLIINHGKMPNIKTMKRLRAGWPTSLAIFPLRLRPFWN